MNTDLFNKLNQLLIDPKTESVDHLTILNEIYSDYPIEDEILKPLIQFYLNGIDDVPTLSQKPNWNIEKYNEHRRVFLDSYQELKALTEKAIQQLITAEKNSE